MEETTGSAQDQEGWASKGPDCEWGPKAYYRPATTVTPSTVQVSPGPHLSWTHLSACREGPGFSGQARLLLGTQLPVLRVGQTSPGPCGRYFYPRQRPGLAGLSGNSRGTRTVMSHLLKDFHGPRFCHCEAHTSVAGSWRPGLLASVHGSVSGLCSSQPQQPSVAVWLGWICVSLPCTPRGFLLSSPTASVSLGFSKHITDCHPYADKYGDTFIFLKQNSITQTHFCGFRRQGHHVQNFSFF